MTEQDKDQLYMKMALDEARDAAEQGEVPVGAILVYEDEILCRAHNQVITRKDPTAHAEILGLRQACTIKNNYRLSGSVLYVTLEPCAMCLGAIVQARISRMVFGAHDPKAGAVESIMKFPFEKMNHRVSIRSGILSEECSRILRDFFKERR
ncbi:tRNA adenosine(34) deaminase TadA [Acidobacteriota bacterium]